jgi:hypothetical protein
MKLKPNDFFKVECVLEKIAKSNNIDNVESIDINITKDSGMISFKKSSESAPAENEDTTNTEGAAIVSDTGENPTNKVDNSDSEATAS